MKNSSSLQKSNQSKRSTSNQFLSDKRYSVNSIQKNSQKNPLTEQEQQLLQTSPLEYYKKKCSKIVEEVYRLTEENKTLQLEVEHLQNLNFGYVKQINNMGEDRSKLVYNNINISEQVLNDVVKESYLKEQIENLEKRLKDSHKDQQHLINHCKYMEKDISNYKVTYQYANFVVNQLKEIGVSTIEELVETLNNYKQKCSDLTHDYQDCGLKNAIATETQMKLQERIESLEQENFELKQLNEDFKVKFNRQQSINDENRKADKNSIYQLKCRVDFLEQQLRNIQMSVQNSYAEREQLNFKIKDIETENQTLRSTMNQFNSNQPTLQGTTYKSKFK